MAKRVQVLEYDMNKPNTKSRFLIQKPWRLRIWILLTLKGSSGTIFGVQVLGPAEKPNVPQPTAPVRDRSEC